MSQTARVNRNFIGGQWVEALAGRTYERRSPFDQSLVAVYQDSDEADVDRAVDAARAAFDSGVWPRMSAADRGAVLHRTAALMRERAGALAEVMAAEVGQPRSEQLKAVAGAADSLDFYGRLVVQRRDEAIGGQREDALGLILKEPVGVVGSLTAWNGPLSIAHKACPGLAAGCTLVMKPAHQSSGAAIQLAQMFEESGLPPGAFNVVTSAQQNGAIAGNAIAASDRVDMVTFTGSSATGKAVMRAAAGNLKRVKLELGGKSPNIIFADAKSLAHTAAVVSKGIFRLSGQACQAGSRVLVQESAKDEFLEHLMREVDKVRLGSPFADDTVCGPLVSADQLQRVQSYVDIGRSEARLLRGGSRATGPGLDDGFFFEPTVFDEVAPTARIAQEEIFGPVLSLITFRDVEEAIAIANSTLYGLAAGCWTTSLDTAMQVARRVRAGVLWVNCYRDDPPLKLMPTGFHKQSGLGREMGPEGLEAFLEVKSVMFKLG